jgi:hypothetical protein
MTEKQISNEELMALEIDRKSKNIAILQPDPVAMGLVMVYAQNLAQTRELEKAYQEKNDHDKKAS